MQYCRQLRFDGTPDYERCRQGFHNVLNTLPDTSSSTDSILFDWQNQSMVVSASDKAKSTHKETRRREYRMEPVKETNEVSWFRQWFCLC